MALTLIPVSMKTTGFAISFAFPYGMFVDSAYWDSCIAGTDGGGLQFQLHKRQKQEDGKLKAWLSYRVNSGLLRRLGVILSQNKNKRLGCSLLLMWDLGMELWYSFYKKKHFTVRTIPKAWNSTLQHSFRYSLPYIFWVSLKANPKHFVILHSKNLMHNSQHSHWKAKLQYYHIQQNTCFFT